MHFKKVSKISLLGLRLKRAKTLHHRCSPPKHVIYSTNKFVSGEGGRGCEHVCTLCMCRLEEVYHAFLLLSLSLMSCQHVVYLCLSQHVVFVFLFCVC